VTQHICGTCRYFEEGGFAASGRCNHPERREIRMMVLVRKNELACREHWDGGLWEPRESLEPAAVSKAPPPTLVAEATVSDHLREQYTDRVTSVGVAPVNRPPAETPTPGEQPPRREAPSPVSSQPVERTIPAAERVHTGTSQETPAPPSALRRESWDAPLPEIIRTEPRQAARDESPRKSRPADPAPLPPQRPSLTNADNFNRSWGAPRAFDEDQIRPVTPRPADVEKRAAAMESRPAARQREERSSNIDDISQLLSRPPRANRAPSEPAPSDPDIERFGSRHPTGASAPAQPPEASLSGGRRGWTEPFETTDQPPQRSPEPARPPQAERHQVGRHQVERDRDRVRNGDVRQQEPRQHSEPAKAAPNPRLASMPQCCGTCRDFRPAEGGERGWCNNAYAFDHRRMVRKNDLACRSTIGDW
jgi:hypothetical protein